LETAIEEKTLEIAKKMILLGIEDHLIAEATMLPATELKRLRSELGH
jgi:hypothetical protein